MKGSPKRSRDRGAAIAIGSQMIFQIGIAIVLSIFDEDRDQDRNLDLAIGVMPWKPNEKAQNIFESQKWQAKA